MPPFSLVNLFLLHILTGDISVVTVHFALSNTVGSLYQSITGSSTRKIPHNVPRFRKRHNIWYFSYFSKYFFRNTSEYFNFKIFGWQHITILFIGILGIISIIKRIAVNRKFERIVGIVLLSQQTILYTWYLLSGYNLLIEGLPLYHCRIAIILMGIGLLFNKSICRKLGSMWGLIGAIFALIYPSGLDPFVFPHITQFSFFIGHLFLLWGAVYCIFIECIKIDKKDFKTVIYFTNIYHIVVFILNHMIGSNYGFMRVSPIGIGNNLHPVVYGIVVMVIFNLLMILMNAFINRQKKSSEIVECLI